MFRGGRCALASCALFFVLPEGIRADTFPRFEGEVLVEANNITVIDSQVSKFELNDFYLEGELASSFRFSEYWSVDSVIKFEAVDQVPLAEERFVEGHGSFVEELFLSYSNDRFGFLAGKFNPAFGVAYNELPGVYAEEISKADYELAERIGFGGRVNFGSDAFGQGQLSAAIFFADTSALSDSIFNDRGRTRLSDRGASNTEDLSSYSAALDIENLAGVEGLNGHIAYRHQEAGIGDYDDDEGLAITLYGGFEIANGMIWEPLIEYVALDAANGAVEDRDIWSVASTFRIRSWSVSATYIDRGVESKLIGMVDINDQVIEITGGYEFDCGLELIAGYLHTELEDVESDGIVAKITYGIEF